MNCHFQLDAGFLEQPRKLPTEVVFEFEVTSEVGIDHFASTLRSRMRFCHIVLQVKEELFRRVIFVKDFVC